MDATPRKADRVARALLEEVVRGEVAPGALLPKETALAEHFGVNRGVIREAIKLLEVHRLVRHVRRRGTEVLDPLASPSPEVLSAMLAPGPGRVDPEVLRDVLEIRRELDVDMCSRAAERRTDADLEALDAKRAELEGALGDHERYGVLVDELSLVIARATHNRIYEMLVHWHASVRREHDALFQVTRQPSRPHLQGVELLIHLIRAKDTELIASVVRGYHDWAEPRLLATAALLNGDLP